MISKDEKVEDKFTLGAGVVKYEVQQKGEGGFLFPQEIHSINEAASLLAEAVKLRGDKVSLVIIDEFDRITDQSIKLRFADLLKRIHDMRVGIKFIFCGIATNLEDLIGQHPSAIRPIHPVPLDLLTHDARWGIVNNAAEKLGFAVNKN